MSKPVPFCWYELMTSDADAASGFYHAVTGWKVDTPQAGSAMDYRMIEAADGATIGGVLGLTAAMQAGGARPGWLPYLAVPDIDAGLSAMLADGARTIMPRTDIPQGSFALLADPQGAPFYVMQPRPPEGQPDARSEAFKADGVGHARWNELATSDATAAKGFYARHFGFEFNNVMPMGEAGDYAFIDFDGVALGAIMPVMDPARPSAWLIYFGVASVTSAKAAIEQAGGTVMMGPHEVPGGDWIVVAADPQGATFGVVGPKGE